MTTGTGITAYEVSLSVSLHMVRRRHNDRFGAAGLRGWAGRISPTRFANISTHGHTSCWGRRARRRLDDVRA